MSRSAVSLLIPNRDGARYLPDCLDAIAAQTRRPDETVVIDDASADESVELLRTRYPWVRVIPSGDGVTPRGFAGSCNAGIRATGGEYVALLNNDTRAEPAWLERLVDALEAAPGAASAAPRMLARDGAHLNAAGLLLTAAGECRALGDGEPDGPRFDRAAEIFGPSGGAALWRRSALDEIGLFEEIYFAYYEDADLAFRARAAGYGSVYAPESRVVHLEGRCPSLARVDKVMLRIRNGMWFAWTNLPAGVLAKRLFPIAWATGWRYFCKYGLRPWKVEAHSFYRAALAVKLHPLLFWRMRRARQAARRVPVEELARWLGHDPFAANT